MAQIGIYIVYLIVALMFLNGAALAVLAAMPRFVQDDPNDIFSRLNGSLKAHALGWFRLSAEQWPVYEAETRLMHRFGYVYEPFVEFRHSPVTGITLNMSEHGFRPVMEQGPWPPPSEQYTIFFFGGSTAMHFGPDWTGIANRLQDALAGSTKKQVKIYNFGRGAYFSSQEALLYLDLVCRGHIPNMAIFLDGLNDFYFHDGVPATGAIFRDALRRHARSGLDETGSRPNWQALRMFWNSLPVPRLIDRLIDRHLTRTEQTAVYRTESLTPMAADAVIRRYLFNKNVIERVSEENGTRAVFVWQPVPGYRYNLRHHIAMHPTQGLCGHERSGMGYARMAEWVAASPMGDTFIWLADLQDERAEPLYVDAVHYTAAFADAIADAIAQALVSRGLLAPSPRPRVSDSETAPT